MSDKEEIEQPIHDVDENSAQIIEDFESHQNASQETPNQTEPSVDVDDVIMTDDLPQVSEGEESKPDQPTSVEEPVNEQSQLSSVEPEIIEQVQPATSEEPDIEQPTMQNPVVEESAVENFEPSIEDFKGQTAQEVQSPVKAFEVAKDGTPEHENEPSITPAPNTTALQEKSDTAESAIDVDSIASFLDVDSKLVGSVDSIILQKLQARVTEFTDLKSEKIVLEVNLEQSTHLSNKRVELFKKQLSKVSNDVGDLREKNSSLEATKFELEKKLAELEMEYKSSSSASQISQSRIDEIVAEKRKTIELLEKKNREVDDYKNELNQVQESNSKLRKELIDLETTNQTTSSSLTHTKFKLQSLETQLDLLTKNNDWLNKEIKTISSDFSEYRKEKSSELSTLQSDYDNKVVEFNSLKARFDNLSGRFDQVSTSLDNALVQVKTLNDEKSLSQEEFFKEISLKDRLVNLLSKSNEGAKAKITHLEELLESSKSDVANESGSLKTTLDKYQSQIEQYQVKIKHLEETIDDLTSTNNDNVPGTPVLSPAAKAAAAKHPGLSLSQLYSDFSLLKKQLTQERRAKERMQQQIDAFVNELEQKAPLINATKERVELLETELTDLSIILETTSKDKESIEKSYKELEAKLQASNSQITTLNKQRVDLARQVQSLLVQVSIRGDSQGPLTPAEKDAFNRIVQGDQVVNESDTDKLISQRLVVFQNIVDLQTKNEELLRITRELGAKLEQEEQTSKSRLENLESSAVNEAKEAILTLQEEITSTETKLNSVTRERDMFRSMLSSKGSNNILTGELVGASNRDSEEVIKLTSENERYQKELSSIHDQLKAVQVESETTINLLNRQINSLSNEKSELAVNLAREKSSNTLFEERYKSLQENVKFARSENEELRKRSELLQDNLAKQDLRTQQVAEELVQTRSMAESLRSESLNLKAEKQLWKSIEKRLAEENTSLIEEKAKLNSLLVNLQTLERERESNAAESQRRLTLQSESLEKELASLRNRLNENANELKEILTRKEADSHTYQERIDSLRNELSTAREELIRRKSTMEQLQSHIDTLTSKLSSAESRIKDYQSVTSSGNSQSSLVQETLKLKEELEDARSSLEDANKSAADFKSIAGAAEEALKSMNATFDDYKENTSSKVAKLESENKTLDDQVSVLNDQITSLTKEITEQKNASVKEIDAAKLEIETLRSQVTDSSKLQSEYDAKVAVIESSYKQQVAIATEAQQNYDKELQKHAEVAKALSLLREESNQLKEKVQGLSSDAKQAREELVKSQESWESQRSLLEEELRIAKERVDDMTSQNNILYNQIESLSKRQQPSTQRQEAEGDDIIPDDSNDELRELINLLRREKDISDAQLEVATRDLKRVSQKLALVTGELDQSRLELSKLQTRDVDSERLSREHEKLLSEINQLNLLRESNTTLRNELQSNIARIKELESQLNESNQKLEPLETDVVRLNAEISHKGQEIKLVMEERDRWRQRSQDILNKYDRVDPAEHEKIKNEISVLTQRNKELEEEFAKEKESSKSLFSRIKEEAQDKLKRRAAEYRQLKSQFTEVETELKTLKESSGANDDLKKQLEDLQNQLDDAKKSSNGADSNIKELEELRSQVTTLNTELENAKQFEVKFNELSSVNANLEAKVKSLEEQIQALKQTAEATPAVDAVEKAKSELEEEKKALEKAKEDLNKQKEEFEAAKSNSGLSKEEIDSKDQALKQQEEKLRAEFDAHVSSKIEEGLELHKKKVREASREKLEQIAKDRLEKYKLDTAENLKSLEKDINDKLEAQYKEKSAALEKEYKEKLSSAGAPGAVVSGDAATVKAEYEEQLTALKKELASAKKASFDEGREATLKEVGMRTKLLQGKVEKLTKDKKALEEKLAGGEGKAAVVSSVPAKPVITANSNQNRVNSANNNQNRQHPGKQFQKNQQHNKQNSNNQGKQGGNKNEGASLKRPADKQAGSNQKKSKNEA